VVATSRTDSNNSRLTDVTWGWLHSRETTFDSRPIIGDVLIRGFHDFPFFVHRKYGSVWWGKFSQKHNYKCVSKWWYLLAMEKLRVSAYSGHLRVLTTFLLKELYIICLNRVVMLISHHHHHLRAFVKLSLMRCLLGQWICRCRVWIFPVG